MKRFVWTFALLAVALVAGGLAWALRPSRGMPSDDARSAAFSIQPLQSGWLIQHMDEQIPLRAFRWVPAQSEGVLMAQLLTQNDEQQVHLFRAGRLEGGWKVERPRSVAESFFRFAELKDAIMLPDTTVLLLYGSGGGPEESLLACLDIRSGSLRWSLRLQGTRFAYAADRKDPAVFVWGPDGPVQRVALAQGRTPHAEVIELPAEVAVRADLLPTGAWSFLLSHAKGLSAYAGTKGWIHHPQPEPAPPLSYPGTPSRLARQGSSIWWQPFPGALYEVGPRAASIQAITIELGVTDSASRDARLLRLLGSDNGGSLWFGLVNPVIAPPAPPAELPTDIPEGKVIAPSTEPVPSAAAPPSPEDVEAWRQHLARGLGRLYRRPAAGGALRVFEWSALWKSWPGGPGLPSNQGDTGLRPESGIVVFETERRAWWLPLSALGDGTAVPAS